MSSGDSNPPSQQKREESPEGKLGRFAMLVGDAYLAVDYIWSVGSLYVPAAWNADKVFTNAEYAAIKLQEGQSMDDAIADLKAGWQNQCVDAKRAHSAWTTLGKSLPQIAGQLAEIMSSADPSPRISVAKRAASNLRSNCSASIRKNLAAITELDDIPESRGDFGFRNQAIGVLIAPIKWAPLLRDNNDLLLYLDGDRSPEVVEATESLFPAASELDLADYIPAFLGVSLMTPMVSKALMILLVSPKALTTGKSTTRRGIGTKNDLKEITPACIAFATTLIMNALSQDEKFTQDEGKFACRDFYYNLIAAMEDPSMEDRVKTACKYYTNEVLQGAEKRKSRSNKQSKAKRRKTGSSALSDLQTSDNSSEV